MTSNIATPDEVEHHEEKLWSPSFGWIAIQAESPGGITCLHINSLLYFETGVMKKKTPIGVSEAKALIMHLTNGASSGIPTRDPEALLMKILEMMEIFDGPTQEERDPTLTASPSEEPPGPPIS